MSELDRLRAALRRGAAPSPWPTRATWAELARDPRARIPPRRTPLLWSTAVILLGLLVLGVRTWQRRAPVSAFPTVDAPASIEAHDAVLGRALRDGSTIALDPGSSGSASEDRNDYVRFELYRGRARFEVTRNPNRSFHVVAGGYDIRVIGTRFTVEVLSQGPGIAVNVERGAVSVSRSGDAPIVLGAGDHWEGHPDRPALESTPLPSATPESAPPLEPSASAIPSSAPASPAARPAGTSAAWWILYREGRYPSALGAARKIGITRLTEELDVHKLAGLADTARFAGDPASALMALSALERRFGGTPQAAQATFLRGRVHAGNGDAADAVVAFERYLAEYPSGSYATEAIGRLAELYSKRGDGPRARQMAERYLQRAPAGPYARLARSLLPHR